MDISSDEGRFSRQEILPWWDQSKLGDAKVLVCGAGGIGNEVAKNLALAGVGHLSIVDMDMVDKSNLARCVFFNEASVGQPKSSVIAASLNAQIHEVEAQGYVAQIQDMGTPFLTQFNLIIGALDNLGARHWVNRAARATGKTWLDGAAEGFVSQIKSFTPSGPCLECGLSASEMDHLFSRKSCGLVSKNNGESLNPTTFFASTISSVAITGALLAQEALTYLIRGEDYLAFKAKKWMLHGETMTTQLFPLSENPNCLAHEYPANLIEAFECKNLKELCSEALSRGLMQQDLNFEFDESVALLASCNECNSSSKCIPQRRLTSADLLCDRCGNELKALERSSFSANESFTSVDFASMRMPRNVRVFARDRAREIVFWVKGHQYGQD